MSHYNPRNSSFFLSVLNDVIRSTFSFSFVYSFRLNVVRSPFHSFLLYSLSFSCVLFFMFRALTLYALGVILRCRSPFVDSFPFIVYVHIGVLKTKCSSFVLHFLFSPCLTNSKQNDFRSDTRVN